MLMLKLRGDSSNGHSSSFFNAAADKRNPFVCFRCKKAFPTTQALGGHQNAHRKERLNKKDGGDMPRLIDFWANEQQELKCDSATAAVNNYRMISPHGVAVMMRDFMGVTTEKRGGCCLDEFPVEATSETYGGGDGGDYALHHELTSKNELDLALKL